MAKKKKKRVQTMKKAMSILDLHSYDKYIVCFSGGKDSVALFGYLVEAGIPLDKIELWHHDIDGYVKKGEKNFMDWPITKAYCKAFAKAFNVPIYFSWRKGGFKQEMLRENSLTGDIYFQDENHKLIHSPSRDIPKYYNTRLKFPQVSPDLSVRWCSAYLKIDICATAIRKQERFRNIKTLVLTGERGEESSARGAYNIVEPDRSDLRDGKTFQRHVDHFRPIRDWSEQQVWDMMMKLRVRPHPAYELGFGRVSCMKCIFGNANQFASSHLIDPEGTKEISDYEKKFGVTIKRNKSVEQLLEEGTPYETITKELALLAMSQVYDKQY